MMTCPICGNNDKARWQKCRAECVLTEADEPGMYAKYQKRICLVCGFVAQFKLGIGGIPE